MEQVKSLELLIKETQEALSKERIQYEELQKSIDEKIAILNHANSMIYTVNKVYESQNPEWAKEVSISLGKQLREHLGDLPVTNTILFKGEIRTGVLEAIRFKNKFISKAEIEEYLKTKHGRNTTFNRLSEVLRYLKTSDQIISVKFNKSNKLTFHGLNGWLSFDHNNQPVIKKGHQIEMKSAIDPSSMEVC